jgi:hypothetical protein
VTREQKEKKSFLFKSRMLLKKIWVLVFSIHIWYLVYPTDRSIDLDFAGIFGSYVFMRKTHFISSYFFYAARHLWFN